jgi:hypothetical protein
VQRDPNLPADLKELVSEQLPEDLAITATTSMLNLRTADNLYYQYQSGFLSEEAWAAFTTELKAEFSSDNQFSIFRLMYETNPKILRASFRNYLDELAEEMDAKSEQSTE